MLSANANTSLSLLVSDFGNGGIDRLLASLLLAEEHLAHPSCAGSSLPFSRIVVSTHDESQFASCAFMCRYTRIYSRQHPSSPTLWVRSQRIHRYIRTQTHELRGTSNCIQSSRYSNCIRGEANSVATPTDG